MVHEGLWRQLVKPDNTLTALCAKCQYVVIDNEAGMAHLSRRTTNNVDLLCIVAEPAPIGIVTCRMILELVEKLPIIVRKTGVIWNKNSTK